MIKPAEIVAQVISQAQASDNWLTDRENLGWLLGVRVHGTGAGVVVKMLEQK